jgi:hypothetical protein
VRQRANARNPISLRISVSVVAVALALATLPTSAAETAKSKHRGKNAGPGLVASDTGADPSPIPVWGKAYCANDDRVQQITTGGDPHLTATGVPQGNASFRRVTLFNGDDSFGERCELGLDSRKGPTAFYRQGYHRITQFSVRLAPGFPLGADTWQVVMQMKQSAPASNSDGTPVLELDAYGGRWRLRQSLSRRSAGDSRELWAAPAAIGNWTRFSFNVRYSTNPKKGFIRLGIDLNGDGDFADPGELSPGFHTYTLKVETPGGTTDGIKPGRPIPSHLGMGLYHNPSIPCPPLTGCQVDLDNMQVLRP